MLHFALYVVPTPPRDLNERTAAATTSLLAIKAAFSLFPITRNHLCARPNLWDVGTKYKAKWSVQRGEEQRGEEGGLPTCNVYNICYLTKLSFSGILGPLWWNWFLLVLLKYVLQTLNSALFPQLFVGNWFIMSQYCVNAGEHHIRRPPKRFFPAIIKELFRETTEKSEGRILAAEEREHNARGPASGNYRCISRQKTPFIPPFRGYIPGYVTLMGTSFCPNPPLSGSTTCEPVSHIHEKYFLRFCLVSVQGPKIVCKTCS